MIESSFNKHEQFNPKVELATVDDWEECKRLRLLEVTGEDAKMFGAGPKEVSVEENRTKEDWQYALSSNDMLFVLSKNGSKSVGLGRAIKEKGKEGVWRLGWGYTEKDFRNKGFGTKNSMLRLKELLKRGAKEAMLYVKSDNKDSFRVQESLGFKIVKVYPPLIAGEAEDCLMMLDLTNPDVIKKINDFVI
jgi:ribosomal protein S18 acetylase RimI-like enzyme